MPIDPNCYHRRVARNICPPPSNGIALPDFFPFAASANSFSISERHLYSYLYYKITFFTTCLFLYFSLNLISVNQECLTKINLLSHASECSVQTVISTMRHITETSKLITITLQNDGLLR